MGFAPVAFFFELLNNITLPFIRATNKCDGMGEKCDERGTL